MSLIASPVSRARPVLLVSTNRHLLQAAALALHAGGYPNQHWCLSFDSTAEARSFRPAEQGIVARETFFHEPSPLSLWLRDQARAHPGAWVIPCCTESVAWVAEYQETLTAWGLRAFPTPSAATFAQLNNKARFTTLLQELGIRHPATLVVESNPPPNLPPAAAYFIKPTSDEGGYGIERVVGEPDCRERLSVRLGTESPLLVQEAIEGHDHDISVLCHHGRIVAYACQRPLAGGGYDFHAHPALYAGAQQICAHTRLHGLAHFDTRINAAGEVYFLECNPRVWASLPAALISGLNFLQLALEIDPSTPAAPRYLDRQIYLKTVWRSYAFGSGYRGFILTLTAARRWISWLARHPRLGTQWLRLRQANRQHPAPASTRPIYRAPLE